MYTLVNRIENKVIAELKNDSELIAKISEIVIENEDFGFSIIGVSDAKEYVEDCCDNLVLLIDSEVNQFLEQHGIEVEENEPTNYVELMMDNHKCVSWNNKQFYLSDSLSLNEEQEKIYETLTYYLEG
jgi:hypothetical protein